LSSTFSSPSRQKYTPQYTFDYDPREFEKYRPKKTTHLGKRSTSALSSRIQNVCSLDDENAFMLLLHFGFGVEYSIIRQLIQTGKEVQGICEAFRFGCQQYLGVDTAISDKSMLAAFQLAMKDYEILFLHKNKGICWSQQTGISLDNGVTTLREALLYARSKRFIDLDKNPPPLENSITLDSHKTRKLAKYIQDLPVEFGSILMLRYFQKFRPDQIESYSETKYVRGKIEYFRRLFTQRLRLEHPISDKSFEEACNMIVWELNLT